MFSKPFKQKQTSYMHVCFVLFFDYQATTTTVPNGTLCIGKSKTYLPLRTAWRNSKYSALLYYKEKKEKKPVSFLHGS